MTPLCKRMSAVDSLKHTAFPLEFFMNNSSPSLHITSTASVPILICFNGSLNSFGIIPYSNDKNRLFALAPVIFTVCSPNSRNVPLVGTISENLVESTSGVSL